MWKPKESSTGNAGGQSGTAERGGAPGRSSSTASLGGRSAPDDAGSDVPLQALTTSFAGPSLRSGGSGPIDDPFALHLPSSSASSSAPVLLEAEGAAPAPAGPRPTDQAVARAGYRDDATTFPDLDAVNRSLGGDFSSVPVHTGPAASAACHDLKANAYTHDGSVAFKSSSPSLETQIHEATHLAQLGHVKVDAPVTGGSSVAALEHEASAVASGSPTTSAPAAAPESSSARDEVLRQDDAGAEGGTGVADGISAGTMTADAIMGQTYTVTCPGEYRVDFTFTKAYKGTYPYAAAGRDVKGVYVRIDARYTDLKMCGRAQTIQLLQVLRNTQPGTDGGAETADPGNDARRQRSGWDDENAPSRGWRVDRLTTATQPFYTSGGMGNEGTEETPAVLWDAPGDWSTTVSAGKDFMTSAVCTDAAGTRTVVGTVNWGYMIDASGAVSFRPSPPTVVAGNPIQTQHAAARWDAIEGNDATGITF